MPLFDPDYVYPSDLEGGRYMECVGPIVEVALALADHWKMTVRTEKGDHTGWLRKIDDFEPKVGDFACIRIYDCGGGWYPDNKIMSVSSTREFI